MAITAKDVNKLRQMTGAGMMDCKKALVESEGDFDTAIEILRKKGQKVSASRADRETTEGAIFIKTSEDNKEAILITLTCETDFVGKNEEFIALGNAILEVAASKKPASIEALYQEQLDGLSIKEKITELVGKIGEKMEVKNYETLTGDIVVPYIHGTSGKLGVLVALKGEHSEEAISAGKDVCMQIAAMNPSAVDKDGVDPSLVENEIRIGKEKAIADGKPAELAEKIAMGQLNKFYKENTLVNQAFVKDNKVSVSKYLDSVQKGLSVVDFKRISIG